MRTPRLIRARGLLGRRHEVGGYPEIRALGRNPAHPPAGDEFVKRRDMPIPRLFGEICQDPAIEDDRMEALVDGACPVEGAVVQSS